MNLQFYCNWNQKILWVEFHYSIERFSVLESSTELEQEDLVEWNSTIGLQP